MEMVDEDESISLCAMVYFVVLISSVKGARKATFFAEGNIGLVCASDRLLRLSRGRGPLLNIDWTLYEILYGTSADNESIVETDVADVDDDDGIWSNGSVALCSSVRNGVGFRDVSGDTLVVRGLRTGLRAPGLRNCAATL